MDIRKMENDNGLIIFLDGKFTFEDREKFHAIALLHFEGDVKYITLDCKGLNYMDSTAVGMVLIMHENATKHGITVKVVNVGKSLRPLFELSALGRLFSVEYLN